MDQRDCVDMTVAYLYFVAVRNKIVPSLHVHGSLHEHGRLQSVVLIASCTGAATWWMRFSMNIT